MLSRRRSRIAAGHTAMAALVATCLLAIAPPSAAESADDGAVRCTLWLKALRAHERPPFAGMELPHGCLLSPGQAVAITRAAAVRQLPVEARKAPRARVVQPAGAAGRAHLLTIGTLLGLSLGAELGQVAAPESGRVGALLSLAGAAGGVAGSLFLLRKSNEDPAFAPTVGTMAMLGSSAALYSSSEGLAWDDKVVFPATLGALLGGAGGAVLHATLRPSVPQAWNTATAAAWSGVVGAAWAQYATDTAGPRTALTVAAMAGGGFAAWRLGTHDDTSTAIGANVGGGIGLFLSSVVTASRMSSGLETAVLSTAIVGAGAGVGALIGWGGGGR